MSKLVNITGVTDTTPLNQTYTVAMDTDAAAKTIGNIKGTVYSRVRREARDVYEEHLATAGSDVEKLVGDAMRAQFKMQMEKAESEYAGKEPDKKAKNTWNQNKRNFCRALALRVDFIELAEVSQGDLTTLCTEMEAEIEAEENEVALVAMAEEKGITVEELKAQLAGEEGEAQAPAAGEPAPAVGEGIVFASDEQKAVFDEMIRLMQTISEKDPTELDGMLKGAVKQLSDKSTKVLAKFAAAK